MATRRPLFVYGSLMRGLHNHRVLENCGATFLGLAETSPGFGLAGGFGFPSMYRGLARGVVKGELYLVPEAALLGPLDMLEGHPTFFRREAIGVVRDGQTFRVEAYLRPLASVEDLPAVPSGDWRHALDRMAAREFLEYTQGEGA